MKRKIIKQGHNTLTVTLPSKWVHRLHLSAGEELELVESDNGLFLSAEGKSGSGEVEIDIGGLDIPTIWKYFMAVYREGYEKVVVKFPPKMTIESPYKFFAHQKLDQKYKRETEKVSVLEFLGQMVNRFIGFEIVDYMEDRVVIKGISEPNPKEFDNSLRRIFLLIQQMADEVMVSLEKENSDSLKHIHDIDVNLDKFHDYCIRTLNISQNKDTKKSSLYFSILYLLEMIGDEFKNISHHIIYDFKDFNYKNLLEMAGSVHSQINLYYSLFYGFDRDLIMKISEIDKQRYFNLKSMNNKIKTAEEKEMFHHLRIIAKYINALVELRIELEF
ncbi:phosphate uptake regulator PhoU [archaeon]|jgi:phosphate uptake regulator|nr:phosphate uptake regulator PhoU [archaeon]